jgi:hypothetical protein
MFTFAPKIQFWGTENNQNNWELTLLTSCQMGGSMGKNKKNFQLQVNAGFCWTIFWTLLQLWKTTSHFYHGRILVHLATSAKRAIGEYGC